MSPTQLRKGKRNNPLPGSVVVGVEGPGTERVSHGPETETGESEPTLTEFISQVSPWVGGDRDGRVVSGRHESNQISLYTYLPLRLSHLWSTVRCTKCM